MSEVRAKKMRQTAQTAQTESPVRERQADVPDAPNPEAYQTRAAVSCVSPLPKQTYPFSDAVRFSNEGPCARIEAVEVDSPAYDAGFEPGCRLLRVNGQAVRDVIDWQWLSAENELTLEYVDNDGDRGCVELERDEGELWGFSFEGLIFDGIRTCRNACTFCFMRQLPKGMRPSLYVRDDDYRLSFLGGTFVTLSNVEPEEEERIQEQRLSPIRVSLHAVDAEVRRRLIGKNAAHGLAVFERLLAAGIEAHVQVVLLPGENDGAVLERTLRWAYAHPGVLNVGIVPLGYTRFQDSFRESFNDPLRAQALLQAIEPFRKQALAERGTPWVYAADEFYNNAFGRDVIAHLPAKESYGDYELFEDGIGMMRSFVDEWACAEACGLAGRVRDALAEQGRTAYFFCGYAMENLFDALLASSVLRGVLRPCCVANAFFGGNVDVTGLLCACDIMREARFVLDADPHALLLVPQVVFNDDGLTLDDMALEDMENGLAHGLCVVSCNPVGFLEDIEALANGLSEGPGLSEGSEL